MPIQQSTVEKSVKPAAKATSINKTCHPVILFACKMDC